MPRLLAEQLLLAQARADAEAGPIHVMLMELNKQRPGTETLMNLAVQGCDKWTALDRLCATNPTPRPDCVLARAWSRWEAQWAVRTASRESMRRSLDSLCHRQQWGGGSCDGHWPVQWAGGNHNGRRVPEPSWANRARSWNIIGGDGCSTEAQSGRPIRRGLGHRRLGHCTLRGTQRFTARQPNEQARPAPAPAFCSLMSPTLDLTRPNKTLFACSPSLAVRFLGPGNGTLLVCCWVVAWRLGNQPTRSLVGPTTAGVEPTDRVCEEAIERLGQ